MINCPICKAENSESAKFCNQCGHKLENLFKTCPNEKCKRSDLPSEALYCPDCGTPFSKNFVSFTEIVNGFCIDMVAVKGTSYRRGDSIETIEDFYISKKPVSLDLYEKTTGCLPSYFCDISMVEPQFKYYDALKFCNKLSELANREIIYKFNLGFTINQANGYQLPTMQQLDYIKGNAESLGVLEIFNESWEEWSLNWTAYFNRKDYFKNSDKDILKFRIVLPG